MFDKSLENTDLILPTERFFSDRPLSIGSSRHAIINDLLVKGIGQNSLNIAYDYPYQWGGLKKINALHGLINEIYASKRSMIKPISSAAIFNYQNELIKNEELSILFRRNLSFRLTNIWPSSLSGSEKLYIKIFITEHFKTSDLNQILTILIENIIHSFSVDITHATPSLANLTITGEWIDTESLIIKQEQSQSDIYLETLTIENQTYFFDSWIHNLFHQSKLMALVINGIFHESQTDFKAIFFKKMNQYLSGEDNHFWFDLLKNYQSWRQLNFDGEEHTKLTEIKNLKPFAQYETKTNDYRSHLQKGLVTKMIKKSSGTLPGDNIFKYFLAINDKGDKWEDACNRYDKLNGLIK